MRIIKAKDYDDMSRKAANIMASVITLDPSCTLGLATGSTPIGLYKNLTLPMRTAIWISPRFTASTSTSTKASPVTTIRAIVIS